MLLVFVGAPFFGEGGRRKKGKSKLSWLVGIFFAMFSFWWVRGYPMFDGQKLERIQRIEKSSLSLSLSIESGGWRRLRDMGGLKVNKEREGRWDPGTGTIANFITIHPESFLAPQKGNIFSFLSFFPWFRRNSINTRKKLDILFFFFQNAPPWYTYFLPRFFPPIFLLSPHI